MFNTRDPKQVDFDATTKRLRDDISALRRELHALRIELGGKASNSAVANATNNTNTTGNGGTITETERRRWNDTYQEVVNARTRDANSPWGTLVNATLKAHWAVLWNLLRFSVTNASGTYASTARIGKYVRVINGADSYGGTYTGTYAPTDGIRFAATNSIEPTINVTTDGVLEVSLTNVWYQSHPPETANKTLAADEWAQFDTSIGPLYATLPSAGFVGGGRKVKISVFAGENPVHILENPAVALGTQSLQAEPRFRRLLWPGECVEIHVLFSSALGPSFKGWVVGAFLPGQNRTVDSSTDITAKAGGTYRMNATAGNRIVTLDLAQLSAGAFGEITLIKTDASANTVTVASQAGFAGIGSATLPAVTPTGNTTLNGFTVSSVSSFVGLFVGMTISGTGIAAGTTIVALYPTTNQIQLSKPATATGSGITLSCSYTETIEGPASAIPLASQGSTIVLRPSIAGGVNRWSVVALV